METVRKSWVGEISRGMAGLQRSAVEGFFFFFLRKKVQHGDREKSETGTWFNF
jgi:hypothetical protein